MTRQALENIIRLYLRSDYDLQHVMTAVDAYSSASNDGKPIVSGSACDCKERRELFERYQCIDCGALYIDRAS